MSSADWGIQITRSIEIGGFATLIACLFLGGCVNDVAVEPEGTDLQWANTGYPGRQRVNDIAVDPEGRIILGAYDYEREDVSMIGAVYVSEDNGETWAGKQFGIKEIRDVAVDSEGRIFAASWESICRSTDHGASWEILNFRSFAIRCIAIDSSDNIYLGMWNTGIYFSADHGDSWTQIGAGISGADDLESLAVNSKGCLFATVGSRLSMSCDRGASWAEPQDVPWNGLRRVAIDGEDRIVVSDFGRLYRSLDDGRTWAPADSLENHGVSELLFDESGRLYVVSGPRVYASDDAGETSNLLMTVKNQIEHVAANAAGDIFVTGEWGVSRSIDGGASAEMLGFFERPLSALAVGANGYCYVAPEYGGVWRSSGALERWERFNGGLPDLRLSCLAIAGDSLLMAGTGDGVYVSPLDRPEWSQLSLAGSSIRKLFAFPHDSIAAFSFHRLRISADGGKNWNDIGMQGYEINALIRTADGDLLAGTSFGGVFRYTGEGILWDQLNEGLGDLRVNALAAARGGAILAGTESGLFISSNGGASWRRFSKEQLTIESVTVAGEDIFLGTERGVFWTRMDEPVLRAQNEGLESYDLRSILTIALDTDDHLLLLTDRRLLRSSTPFGVLHGAR